MTKTKIQKAGAKPQKSKQPPLLPVHGIKGGGNATERRIAAIERKFAGMSVGRGKKNGILDESLGTLARHAGNLVGSFFGQPTIFGMGAYKMKTNTLWNSDTQTPSMHSTNEKVILRHKEYITTVAAGSAYAPLAINPGNPSCFPWLSNIASNFQEYRFLGLVFHYKSTSAVALVSGTNTALGTFSMSCQYRADALTPQSRQDLLTEMWAVDVKVSDDVCLPIECAPRENPMDRLYIRTFADNIPIGADIKMFDLGKVDFRIDGYQIGQTNVVGEIWVTYEIELYKPTRIPGLIGIPLHLYFASVNHTNANPLGTSVYTIAADQDSWSVNQTNNYVLFPNVNAQYWVSLCWTGNVAVTAILPSLVGTGGLNIVSLQACDDAQNNKSVFCLMANGVMNTVAQNGAVPTLGFGTNGTLPTTPTGFFLQVLQVAPVGSLNAYGNTINYTVGGEAP